MINFYGVVVLYIFFGCAEEGYLSRECFFGRLSKEKDGELVGYRYR
jgi:hypothetical protein